MTKKIFGTMAVVAAFSFGYCAYNAYQTSNLSNMALANIEALSEGESKKEFYAIAKYDICSELRITSVEGEIGAEVSVGLLISSTALSEIRGRLSGEVEFEKVNLHNRVCLDTSEPQKIDCIPGSGWVECHSQCDHTNNQI